MLQVERGGEQSDPSSNHQEEKNEDWYGTQQQQHQQQQQQQYQPYPYNTNDNYPGQQYNSAQQQQQPPPEQLYYGNPYGTPPPRWNQAGFDEVDIDHLDDDPMRETVQDQVDRWKAVQQQQQAQMEESLHDAQGRVKLMTTLGKGSRILTFVFLLWRDVYFYEQACNVEATASSLIGQFYGGFLRVHVVSWMLLNGIGIVASLMASSSSSSSHQTKKRLKAILNMHKLVELVLACWCFFKWITPSTTVPREQLMGSMIHSFAFIVHCQAVTKYSWDETSGRPLNSYKTTTTNRAAPNNNAQSLSSSSSSRY